MTTHLVISDIHQDIKSLQSLLEKYQGEFYDIWCLGDVAGHGEHINGTANVNECFRILNNYHLDGKLSYVAGNWEKWISIPSALFSKNQSAMSSQINEMHLNISNQDYLTWVNNWDWLITRGDFTLTHGWIEKLIYQNDREPWETYLEERDSDQVTNAFLCERIPTPHALVGHTHDPGFFKYNGKSSPWYDMTAEMIDKNQSYNNSFNGVKFRYILNPGALTGARSNKYNGLKTAILLNTEEKYFRFISL